MAGCQPKRKLKMIACLLISVMILSVLAEEFGDGKSFFGEGFDGISPDDFSGLCDGKECKVKTVKGVTPEEAKKAKDKESKDAASKSSDSETGSKKRKIPEPEEINVIITFTNAVGKIQFHDKFQKTVTSLLKHASVPIALHILGDPESQAIAKKIIKTHAKPRSTYRLVGLNIKEIAEKTDEIFRPMQAHFSYKPGAYYSDALFFLSISMHLVMPDTMHKVIMLDADLKFDADIAKLYERFRLFRKENIIGIGYDLQPVYRHNFWAYRQRNKNTRVGEPGPDGLQGFNSGVLLLDLDKIRHNTLYNSLLNGDALKKLTEEYFFKGHLGDQDFFTLIGMKYEWLFHVLPCQWNRQLCRWWEDKGYKEIFSQYFTCEGDINIWHGNCNTPIP